MIIMEQMNTAHFFHKLKGGIMKYRIILQINVDETGLTYGPEPVELHSSNDPDSIVESFETILEKLGFFDDLSTYLEDST